MWSGLAGITGGVARAAGRNAASARDLEPEHRRDGAGLALIVVGFVLAVATWFHAAGPIGRGLETGARVVLGNGALLLPLALFAAGVHLLRQAPQPESRGRVLVGTVAITLAVTGLFDLWSDGPARLSGREHAGGLLGAVTAHRWPTGWARCSAFPSSWCWVAFGVLVLTATPVSALVAFVRTPAGWPATPVDPTPHPNPRSRPRVAG